MYYLRTNGIVIQTIGRTPKMLEPIAKELGMDSFMCEMHQNPEFLRMASTYLKDIPDVVTTHVEEDGIFNALKKLELI